MKNIYKVIESPFEREGFLEELLNVYCNNTSFYKGLIYTNLNEKISGRINIKDVNDFQILLFNCWKNMIHRIRCANYLKEPYKSKIDKIDSYLQSINPTTAEEINKILNGELTRDKELKDIIDKYRWNRLGEYSSWQHIDSSYIAVGMHERQPIEHRLYINCDSTKTHFIMRKFIEKCREAKSKYYFKFDIYGDRADTVVIYSDTLHLEFYINTLNEIIEENDLSSAIHNPPLLTGKIGKYLGYGSEPQEEEGQRLMSFNTKREEHLERCIREETVNSIKRNLNNTINYSGRRTLYSDFLIESIISIIRQDTLEYMQDDEEANKRRGYSKKEVQSSFFDIVLINEIKMNLEEILEQYKNNNLKPLQIKFGKGILRISKYTIEKAIKNQIKTVWSKSTKYKERLRERILKTSSEYDIDKDNYAVDLSKCAMLGKGVEDDFNDINPVNNESEKSKIEEKQKLKRKRINYTPMTDQEIEESRRKLGI